ncbi:MAG: hypothetical protein Q4E53_00945 [Eubacteriales bacterium]|nr:hypothetical protein [Eubacteriales bacterium]
MELEKYYQKLKKYNAWLWMSLLLLSFCLLGKGIYEEYALHRAKDYIALAHKSSSCQKKLQYYKKAILWSPGYEEIYQGITEKWLFSDSYAKENSVKLFTLLEETNAMKELKFRNPRVYAQFNYKMGFAYFYDLGQASGRKEAVAWFSKAMEREHWLSKEEKDLSEILIALGKSEQANIHDDPDFYSLFQTLQQLNNYSLPYNTSHSSSQESVERAYKISSGILSDLRGNCKNFLTEEKLQAKDLYYEVNRAERILMDSRYEIKQKQKEQLSRLAADTRKRIQIMEEAHEKEE